MSLEVSIVIPVFNNANFTKSALIDLSKLSRRHEIIVVDNNSTDNTESIIESLKLNNLRYLKNDSNVGFAAACNRGYNESTKDNVLFLNNDIRVQQNHSDWVECLLEWCSEYLVGPTGGLIDAQGNFIKETNRIETGNFYMSGWCLASSKKNWDRLIINNYLGPFSEEFGKAYFEDTDLGLRAAELSIPFKIQAVPVHHFGKMTSKKIGVSALYGFAKNIFKEKWNNRLK